MRSSTVKTLGLCKYETMQAESERSNDGCS